MSDQNDLAKFSRKSYRDGYLQSKVRGMIAYQIQALRERTGLKQIDFAKRIGKTQSVVSRLEDTEYGRVTVQTLLDIACALDVALVVKFASYPDFLTQTRNVSVEALQPPTIQESLSPAEVPDRPTGSAHQHFLEYETTQYGGGPQDQVANDNENFRRESAAPIAYGLSSPLLGRLSHAGAA